jgi:hypothetical protein
VTDVPRRKAEAPALDQAAATSARRGQALRDFSLIVDEPPLEPLRARYGLGAGAHVGVALARPVRWPGYQLRIAGEWRTGRRPSGAVIRLEPTDGPAGWLILGDAHAHYRQLRPYWRGIWRHGRQRGIWLVGDTADLDTDDWAKLSRARDLLLGEIREPGGRPRGKPSKLTNDADEDLRQAREWRLLRQAGLTWREIAERTVYDWRTVQRWVEWVDYLESAGIGTRNSDEEFLVPRSASGRRRRP